MIYDWTKNKFSFTMENHDLCFLPQKISYDIVLPQNKNIFQSYSQNKNIFLFLQYNKKRARGRQDPLEIRSVRGRPVDVHPFKKIEEKIE